jgi:hypothetical protein
MSASVIIVFSVLLVAAWVVWNFVRAAGWKKQNRADGVIASWEHLRVTPTELIEGYKANAKHHSLAGLSARVETSGSVISNVSGGGGMVRTDTSDERQVHVMIEGPSTAIVYTLKLRKSPDADTNARWFASKLNMASRQFGPQPRGMEAREREGRDTTMIPPPPPTPVPAGWYPDPTTGQLQRYWDGTRWTEHTAPRV